jgi:hypothetical protein
VAEVCEQLCVRMDRKCKQEVARNCRARCKRYRRLAAGCESETLAALRCQATAQDAPICLNYAAPSCLKPFQELQRCHRGEVATAKEPNSPPAGWKTIADEELGIMVALPENAKLEPNRERRTWQGEEGGVTYYVTLLKPPPEELSESKLLRMVIEHVEHRCQRGLKVHASFQSKGVWGTRYHSRCHDGSERHGMLRIRRGMALAIGYRAPAGKVGVLEPFLDSFEFYEP